MASTNFVGAEPSHVVANGIGKGVVALLALAVFINYVDRGNLATAAPLIGSELKLSNTQIGLLLSAFFWTYTPGQILSGWLAERINAYRTLASSGAGLLISGNVMVDGTALEAPRNVVIEDDRHHEHLRRWASAAKGTPAKFILQLSHPGRQTMRGNALPGREQDVVGPSAVSLTVGGKRMFSFLGARIE